MKRTRLRVEQIAAVLKQAEMEVSVADLIRHLEIAEQTCNQWKRRYSQVPTVEPGRLALRALELWRGARFENPDATETIGPNRTLSFPSQSLTDEAEAGEKPIKHDRTR